MVCFCFVVVYGCYLWVGEYYGWYCGQVQGCVIVGYVDCGVSVGCCCYIDELWLVGVVVCGVDVFYVCMYVGVDDDSVLWGECDVCCIQCQFVCVGCVVGGDQQFVGVQFVVCCGEYEFVVFFIIDICDLVGLGVFFYFDVFYVECGCDGFVYSWVFVEEQCVVSQDCYFCFELGECLCQFQCYY